VNSTDDVERRQRRSSWFFVSETTEPRVRRPVDGVRLILGLVIIVITARGADELGTVEKAVLDTFDAFPSWTDGIFSVAYFLGLLFSVVLVIAAVAGGRERRDVLRDLLVAAAGALALAALLLWAIEGEWPELLPEFRSDDPVQQFPVFRVALVMAVLTVASPHLVRPLRRFGGVLVTLVFLSGIGIGVATPNDAVGAVGVGLAVGGTVLLAFGSPKGYPNVGDVATALDELGIRTTGLQVAPVQSWGVRLLDAERDDGTALRVKVYGRDASDAQVLAKAWRNLWYRDRGPGASVSRLQQAEHEALLTMLASRAEVATPEVVAAAMAGKDDAVLVVDRRGSLLADLTADDIGDDTLTELWRSVQRLHATGINHGGLNVSAVRVDGATPIITDFQRGSLGATSQRKQTDIAELLTSLAASVGAERSVSAAFEGLGEDEVVASLSYLQVAALSTETRKAVEKPKTLVAAVRDEVVSRTGAEVPPPAKVVRVSLKDFLLTALTALVVYKLISELTNVDFASVADEFRDATWAWIVAGFVVAQLVFWPNATGMMAAVTYPIPLKPTVILQSAMSFIGIAIPGVAGRVATNIAYLRKFGVPTTVAVSQGPVDSLSGFILQVVILGAALIFGDYTISALDAPDANWWAILLVVILVVAVVVAVVSWVKVLRDKVLPPIKEAAAALWAVIRDPNRALMLFGSNLAFFVLQGLALWFTVRAFGEAIPFTAALLVATSAGLLAGLVPIPGGVGVAEGVLTAGLVAVGVSSDVAMASAIAYRVSTFYLPPTWGFFSMRWLNKNGYL
jgi:uncharacterized membrane protein YbhN (UPF0104 family)/tRNA A-37 threonylcarbamoyl transferase component Bud32